MNLDKMILYEHPLKGRDTADFIFVIFIVENFVKETII